MRFTILLVFATIAAAQPALQGLGSSSYFCVDRDGDGYGTGPVSLGPYTDLVIDASDNAKVTSASHSFVASDVNRVITITSGAGFTREWYLITAVSAGAATLQAPTFGAPVGTVGSTGGHWVIYGCLGADADDLDATVHTATDVLTKYSTDLSGHSPTAAGTMQAYLQRLSFQDPSTGVTRYYNPIRIWLLDATGTHTSSTTGRCTAAAFETSCLVAPRDTVPATADIAPGDLILVRANMAALSVITPPSGTQANPIILMSYPGEVMAFTQFGGFRLETLSWIILDGFQSYLSDDGIRGGFNAFCIFRHIYGGPANLEGIGSWNGGHDMILEDNLVAHNVFNSGEAGIYVGCNGNAGCSNVTIRRNIAYNNGTGGIHWNGIGNNLLITQNISHSNREAGLSLQSGMTNSTVTANLAFNNRSPALLLFQYKDNDNSCGTAPCGTGPTTGNLFENNSFISLGDGTLPPGSINACAEVANSTPVNAFTNGPFFDMGHNTFRNNLCVNAGSTAHASFLFLTFTTTALSQSYLATSAFDHNLTWQVSSPGNQPFGIQPPSGGGFEDVYTCGAAPFTTGSCANNITTDPKLVALQSSYYYDPSLFDLRIYDTSPAFHAGTATGVPSYDVKGRSYIGSPGPSIGAIERQLYKQGWNDLGAASSAAANQSTVCAPTGGVSGNAFCPGGITGCSGAGTDPYPYQAFCKFQEQAWNGAFLRDKPGSEALYLAANGGHHDSGDNSVIRLTLNTTAPAISRVIDPTPYPSGSTLGTFGTASANNAGVAPTSRHTYGGPFWIPDLDLGGVFSGSIMSGNGGPCHDLWTLDMPSLTWAQRNPTAGTDPYNAACNGSATEAPIATAYDPVSKSLYMAWPEGFWGAWTPSTNTSYNAGFVGYPGSATPNMAIDWYRRIAVEVSSGFIVWNRIADGPTSLNTGFLATGGTSCQGLATSGPGLAFQPILQKIVGWPENGGNTVYFLDSGTNTCTTQTFTGGPPAAELTAGFGVYGKWRYSSGMDVFALIPDYHTSAGAAMHAYVLNLNPSDPVGTCSITTFSLPGTTVGTPYSQTLAQTGCTSSTWGGFTATGACSGLALNSSTGALTGTPTTAGTCSFTATYDTATQPLSITVAAAASNARGTTVNGLFNGVILH